MTSSSLWGVGGENKQDNVAEAKLARACQGAPSDLTAFLPPSLLLARVEVIGQSNVFGSFGLK